MSKLCEMVEAIVVSKGTLVSILHDKSDIRNISSSWVLCLFSAENKCNCEVTSEAFVAHTSEFERVSASICNCRQNMDTPQHTQYKGAIKAVDC